MAGNVARELRGSAEGSVGLRHASRASRRISRWAQDGAMALHRGFSGTPSFFSLLSPG